VLSFDVDGVVADGEFIPVLNRTPARYQQSWVIEPKAAAIINHIATYIADVYFVSSRSCTNATVLTRRWLYGIGVDPDRIAGVICNVVPAKKVELVQLLHATYHFDDDPKIIATMPQRGVLVACKDTPGNAEALSRFRSVRNWQEIETLCMSLTPHRVAFAPQQAELPLVA
jgi:hypothetical protein